MISADVCGRPIPGHHAGHCTLPAGHSGFCDDYTTTEHAISEAQKRIGDLIEREQLTDWDLY